MQPTFEVFTRRTATDGAAARWHQHYIAGESIREEHRFPVGQTAAEIHAALVTLGPHPDPADVDRVIGNNSWTSPPTCDHCRREDGVPVVQLGEEPDYESNTTYICESCLTAALAAVRAVPT